MSGIEWGAEAWSAALLGAAVVGLSKTGVPGLGLLAVSIFANLLPVREASGFLLPLLIVGDLIAVRAYRRNTDWSHLRRLFGWTGLGVVLGSLVMGMIDDGQASRLVGGLVLGFACWQIWKKYSAAGPTTQPGGWFTPVIGVAAGFTTLLANAAGPLMAVYLVAMGLPKLAYVGTAAVFFLLLNLFKVPFMIGLGLIDQNSLFGNVLLAPMVLVGAWAGKQLLPMIPQRWFEISALGLSVLAGLRLLVVV